MANAGEVLSVLLLASSIAVLMLGFGVAFSLAAVGLLFAALGAALDVFEWRLLATLPGRYFSVMQNEVLVAVPLFIFMGTVLERSGIAEELLETAGRLFGRLRGGIAISVVLVGALFAASTGIVGAAVVTMGMISLPLMLRVGYDPRLASGTICASATLAQIIPPSTILIFVGDMLQAANSQAQLARGNMAPDPVSVGDLFFGALVPGLMLTGFYIVWIVILAFARPTACPPLPKLDEDTGALGRRVLRALLPPLILVIAVLGSILGGVATPTESAAVGAVAAMALAAARGQLGKSMLAGVVHTTARLSSMAFLLLFGASLFILVFRGLGGDVMVEQALKALPGGLHGAMAVVMALMFVLGFFLDPFEIIFIMVPIAGPTLITLGADPLWLGVMIGINLQTSFLTPPFGFSLFYLRSVAPPAVTTGHIYRGIAPFVLIQLIGLAMVWLMPPLATELPRRVFGY
ncbi:MAG: TRAP transporter large permease subunit [Burkholderiales bacterium]|jgi:tripartite ATP-independent transporter DctM subunit|nr:TRAP transporter large permease subunit [Burkholderiales bacterium]